MQLYSNQEECCGCTACISICPNDVIVMHRDEKGFDYPQIINTQDCIECGLCLEVCPHKQQVINKEPNIKMVYGLQHMSKDVLKSSSSGGAFTAISDVVLSRGGVVFGAIMDHNFDVFHQMAQDAPGRDRMRGSKYVQSEMRNTYKTVKEELIRGTEVLFIGTPCQVAGLNSFLDSDYPNLYTVDFLCHGTPSTLLLKDHIAHLEKRFKKKATSYFFRDKKYGWGHDETIGFSDGSYESSLPVSSLKDIFNLNLNLRSSCYKCKYASPNRESDLTIADFWGAERILKKYDNKGTSLVLVNSDKGESIFNLAKKYCEVIKTDLSNIKQSTLWGTTSKVREDLSVSDFWNLYHSRGYEAIVAKYCKKTFRQIVMHHGRRLVSILHLEKIVYRIKTSLS